MLSVNELRILQASLLFALDQIEEAEAALGAVSPRTSNSPGSSPASRKSGASFKTNGAPWTLNCTPVKRGSHE